MHLSICCPTLPLLGCIGDLPGDLTQDFPPGVGNLTVKSLMLPRGSIEMYTGFDTLVRPLRGEFDIGLCQIPTIPPMLPGRGNTLIGAGCAPIAHKGERSPFYSTHHSHAQHTLLHCQEKE